ncbi:NAD-dependent epimerase/dehydratase family protein [Dethiosulfatarculus sandiegensis]|uniref:Epimerase n=1 Tax=Dethiosulfatarculus sandiegensis TaxID=1429043 RepID=A0A0D2GDY3_9BACT|nr:NAD-dependent epimerase/dehydratase family protein [Dethiosulfatarculus sandiegensis]KIX13202.1 epimerase [Dethiosulfatarculus sandiegensis]
MSKILITGGAGFVGRHFCHRLLEAGDQVHCVDSVAQYTGGVHPDNRWPLFEPRDFDNFHFYHQDCREFFQNNTDTDFDYVFHLAAMVGGRLMIENNPLAVADDLAIDSMYWQWAQEARPGKSVCFSSSAAYPIKLQTRENNLLLKEDMIDFSEDIGMPDMSYGWSKLTLEYLCRLAYAKHGLKSVAYRPFSGYGEDQDMTYPFPSICQRALDNYGAETLMVWGSGLQMRDFIHIEDCVTGVLTTMDKVDDGKAINLSTGVLTNFRQLAGMMAEKAGYSPEIVSKSDKPEGVFARGGDTEKQKTLGFEHSISLDQGIGRALEYLSAKTERA